MDPYLMLFDANLLENWKLVVNSSICLDVI